MLLPLFTQYYGIYGVANLLVKNLDREDNAGSSERGAGVNLSPMKNDF